MSSAIPTVGCFKFIFGVKFIPHRRQAGQNVTNIRRAIMELSEWKLSVPSSWRDRFQIVSPKNTSASGISSLAQIKYSYSRFYSLKVFLIWNTGTNWLRLSYSA